MINKFKFILIFIFLNQFAFGQKIDSLKPKTPIFPLYEQNDSLKILSYKQVNVLGIMAGYSLGKYSYGELGVAMISNSLVGHHPFSTVKFISTEFRIGQDFIVGPKIGVWASGGSSAATIGINAIYYTDFNDGAFVFRPEVGIGLSGFKLVYGYNWNLTNKDFRGINTHFAGITIFIPVKKAQITREINIRSSHE